MRINNEWLRIYKDGFSGITVTYYENNKGAVVAKFISLYDEELAKAMNVVEEEFGNCFNDSRNDLSYPIIRIQNYGFDIEINNPYIFFDGNKANIINKMIAIRKALKKLKLEFPAVQFFLYTALMIDDGDQGYFLNAEYSMSTNLDSKRYYFVASKFMDIANSETMIKTLTDAVKKLPKEIVAEMKCDIEGYRLMMGEYAYEILKNSLRV